MEALKWKKSTKSGTNGGDCVEVAETPSVVYLRDSKDRSGPVLAFEREAWRAFIAGLK